MLDERTRTVQAGYDALAPAFVEWTARIARVLDLGCGAGRVAGRLAERCDVLGVDVSEEQLRLARTNAPTATFVHGDFAELEFPDRSFDAVTALYSIVHVPRDEHAALFGRIGRWLKPGGYLLASLSHIGGPDRTEQWLGVDMFFSAFDAETNSRLVREAGFEPLVEELIFMGEPEGEVGFLWALAHV